MSSNYTTKLKLAMKSGNRCALCKCALFIDNDSENDVLIAEAAHICGEKPNSARYRSDMTDQERNSFNNLIYLCPTCHTKIDKQVTEYSADKLLELKKGHEDWVKEQLDQSMSKIGFSELDIAIKALIKGAHASLTDDFRVISPDEKIKKNELSDSIRSDIAMGLSKSHEVKHFLSEMAKNVDPGFQLRLIRTFQDKYNELRKTLSGDDLFNAMLDFTQAGQKGFRQQAAALAILSYLFHLCEVFEK